MGFGFYDLGVPTFLQTTRAVGRCLERAERHCARTGTDPDRLAEVRLHPDMAPLHFQIEALTHHAVWGLEAVRTGVFAPPPLVGLMPFAALRATVGRAAAALEALSRAEMDALTGRPLVIDVHRPVDEENPATSAWAPRRLVFTAETYLLSYALPNFHFHAATAYGILRAAGVPLSKRDFEGDLRADPA